MKKVSYLGIVSVERQVFECLQNSDSEIDEYEPLEDDFISIANEGKLAV
jgi:hypothetical protein